MRNSVPTRECEKTKITPRGVESVKLKLISCNVFLREACLAISQSPHVVDPEFHKLGAHENAARLHREIQESIDAAEGNGYDAIVLGYGLCGNAAVGITARCIPVVMPRAHDCCTIFLGSKERFKECFSRNLSAQWSCTGYMERAEDYFRETDTGKLLGLDRTYKDFVREYGEENARYIWETLYRRLEPEDYIFIDIPEIPSSWHLEKLRALAAQKGKEVKVLEGSMRLLRGLMQGDWDERDYLIVPPGRSVAALYDCDTVVTLEPEAVEDHGTP